MKTYTVSVETRFLPLFYPVHAALVVLVRWELLTKDAARRTLLGLVRFRVNRGPWRRFGRKARSD